MVGVYKDFAAEVRVVLEAEEDELVELTVKQLYQKFLMVGYPILFFQVY